MGTCKTHPGVGMKIRFEATGADCEQDLWTLYTWLRDDRTLQGQVTFECIGEQAQPGDMGAGLEAVVAVVSAGAAVVSAGAAVGQLTASIREWHEARRPRSIIVVVVSDGDPKDVQPIIDALPTPGTKA